MPFVWECKLVTSFRRYSRLLLFCCIPYVIWSIYWSRSDFYIGNIEATWHVMHTVNSLESSGIADHYLLPTITLGNPLDKGIGWGAAAATSSGHLIYTSFYSPAFIFAALVLKTLPFLDSFSAVVSANIALGVISALLTYSLAFVSLKDLAISDSRRAGSAFFGALISLYCRENLVSHGVVYWAQSLNQVFLGLLLICLVRHLNLPRGNQLSRKAWIAIFILTYVCGLIEWTGILFGVVASIHFCAFSSRKYRFSISGPLFLGALASFLTIIAHFSLAIGFHRFLFTSLGRFGSRSGGSGSLFDLAHRFVISYGPWLITCLLAFVVSRKSLIQVFSRSKILNIILLASLPLLEN